MSWSACARGALFPAGGLIMACTLIVNAREQKQCGVDADCVGHGFPPSVCVNAVCVPTSPSDDAGAQQDSAVDPWACVGAPAPPQQSATAKVNIRRRFIDWITEAPRVPTGTVCGAIDITCGAADQLGPMSTGSDGYANVSVPTNFRGFLSLTGTLTQADGGATGRMPLYLPVIPVPTVDEAPTGTIDRAHSVPTVQWEQWEANMDSLLSLTQENSKASLSGGHILLTVFDCTGNPAPDVAVSLSQHAISPMTTPFYISDATSLPVSAQAQAATGANGGAGFVNAPPGNLTLKVQHTVLKETIASYAIPVQAGVLTYVSVWPN